MLSVVGVVVVVVAVLTNAALMGDSQFSQIGTGLPNAHHLTLWRWVHRIHNVRVGNYESVAIEYRTALTKLSESVLDGVQHKFVFIKR